MYDYGFGVNRNLKEAVKWYRKSASNGNRDANISFAAINKSYREIVEDNVITTHSQDPASFQHIRTATIEVFNAYLYERNLANGLGACRKIRPSRIYAMRIHNLRNVDMRGIDPALGEYINTVYNKFLELFPLEDYREEEYAYYNNQITDDEDDNYSYDDSAGNLVDMFVAGGQKAKALHVVNSKWEPLIDRVEYKYLPKQTELLKLLSQKYQYPFYSAVYGK